MATKENYPLAAGDKGLTEVSATGTSPTLALIAGWLIPGAGHFLLRKWGRGILLAFAILCMFIVGLAVFSVASLACGLAPTLGILLLVLGGWPYLFWGIFFRTVLGLHSTWLVNSATHMWGSRRFQTSDTSRNSFWVALLTFGEGWHNNHHAHPQSSRHGLAWYEFDPNWYGISVLRIFGLAWDVKARSLHPKSEAAVTVS